MSLLTIYIDDMKNKGPLAKKDLQITNNFSQTFENIKTQEAARWSRYENALKTKKEMEKNIQVLQSASNVDPAIMLEIQEQLRKSRMQTGKEFRFAALSGFEF